MSNGSLKSSHIIGMYPWLTSRIWQLAAAIATWMLAANSTPLPQACGARRTPCALVSAAIRLISVSPPARATSGCDRDGGRPPHLGLAGVVVRRDRLLEPGDVVFLQLLRQPDGGRHFQRAM